VPVSGRFTADQRALYQAVRDAQAAAERASVVGATWRTVTDSARAALERGLAGIGLIEAPGATYDCGPAPASNGAWRQCPQVGLFWYHGLGHGIGLEVHDPDQGVPAGALGVGSAFTIEPGAYVRGGVLALLPDTPRNRTLRERIAPAVRRLADMGVRIEDDYLLTARGLEWISRAPREIAEVEAAMRLGRRADGTVAWRGPSARDAALVESYVPR
jgi:Xaa-Pro aminopeptidase